MSIESIGVTSSRNYVDVVKNVNNINKTSQTQVKAAEDVVKKPASAMPVAAATAAAAATVSAEAKGAAAEEKKEEEAVAASSKIKDAVDKVNQNIVPSKTRCEFSYHEDTNRISIKVIDQETEETIKEIPAEETLDMLSKIWEFAGVLVDERR